MKRSKHYFKLYRSRVTGATQLSLTVLLLGLVSVAAAQASESFDFQLEDQFGATLSGEGLQGRPTILIGGGRKASEHSRDWALEVHDLLDRRSGLRESVVVLRVADLRGLPRMLEPAVTAALSSRYQGSVLMDWDGELTGRYNFVPKEANLVVFDRDRSLRFQASGKRFDEGRRNALNQILSDMDRETPSADPSPSEPADSNLKSEDSSEASFPFWRKML